MAEQPVDKSAPKTGVPFAQKVPEPVKVPFAAKPEPSKPVPVAPVTSAKIETAAPVLAKTAPVLAKPKPVPARVAPKPAPVAAQAIVAEKTPNEITPAKIAPIKIAVPVEAPLTTEGKATVDETFTKIENNTQNFAADATTKVKAAVEKGTKGIAELVEFSKGNVEAVVTSGKIATKGAEEIARYATDYGRSSIEKANATAKQFAAVKSPTEFFQLQSEFAKSSIEAFVGEASKFGENYMKLLGEIAQPIQSRYALAVEKVKTAVAA